MTSFGKRHRLLPGELDIASQAPLLDEAGEFLRMWNRPGSGVVCFIDPAAVGADPAMFGIALADAIRHGAKAYANAVGITEEHALARICEGFEAESGNPTGDPREVGNKEGLN